MGSEKRRHERFNVSSPLNVIDTISAQSLGVIVNVSIEGMMLLGSKNIVDGAVYQVDIPLEPAEGLVLSMGIECLWSADADSGGKSWSGFSVIDIGESDKHLLNQLIAQL